MITVSGLSKSYGRKQVLADLTFTVPDGQVTGFLGPNGAGKSTAMRCMLGLDKPQAGSALFTGYESAPPGIPFHSAPHKAQLCGALLDSSWYTPGRSAIEHLRVHAVNAGVPLSRATEMLDLVGLTAVAKKPVKAFSLGMKQRLGIALTMLGRPKNLLFDEPVNGLDPEGIHWVRQFVKSAASEGAAVLISSHLLAEMQLTADRLVVIGRGRLVGEYDMSDFLAGAAVSAWVDKPTELVQLLRSENIPATSPAGPLGDQRQAGVGSEAAESTPAGPGIGGYVRVPVPDNGNDVQLRYHIGQLCVTHGITPLELKTEHVGLEEKFLAATSGEVEYRTGGRGVGNSFQGHAEGKWASHG